MMNPSNRAAGSIDPVAVIAMVIGTLMFFLAPRYLNRQFLTICSVCATCVVASQFYRKSLIERPVNWISVDVVTIGSFYLVHFVYIELYLLGALPQTISTWKYGRFIAVPVVCKTTALALVGIGALAQGFNSTLKLPPRIRPFLEIPRSLAMRWLLLCKIMTRSGLALFVTWVTFVGVQVLYSGKYGGTGFGTNAATLLSLSIGSLSVGMCIASVLIVHNKKLLQTLLFDIGATAVASLALLLHGDRGGVLTIVFPLIVAPTEYRRPVRLSYLIIIGLLVLSSFGISQVARSRYDRSLTGFVEAANESASESVMLSLTTFSWSSFTAFVAVDYVPKSHGYYYGKMQLPHIVGIIPYTRTALRIYGEDYNSAYLLTSLVLGRNSKVGVGTSMTAEAYLDFGLVGVCFVLWAVGYFIRRLQTRARSQNSLLFCVAHGISFAPLALAARGSVLGAMVREVFYPVLFMMAVAYVLKIPTSYKHDRSTVRPTAGRGPSAGSGGKAASVASMTKRLGRD